MRILRLALFVAVVTTAMSGVYFVAYLYRWEMHRATIAGILFLAGEIALVTLLILRRLDRREESARSPAPVAMEPPPVEPPPVERGRVGAPDAEPAGHGAGDRHGAGPFPWLQPDRFSVFVPILLGAGIIVSGAAWLVEHLAHNAGRFGSPRRRAAVSLELPAGNFLQPGGERSDLGGTPSPATGPPAGRRRPHGERPRSAGVLLARIGMVLLVGGLASALVTLALLGRNRPDPDTSGMRSHLVLSVDTYLGLDHDLAARGLWAACHPMAQDIDLVALRPLASGNYLVVLEPALGEQARRRLYGCLSDGTVERVSGGVVSHEVVEARAGYFAGTLRSPVTAAGAARPARD